MALFSFRHSVRTFSPKRSKNERAAEHGQTAAHLRYITRASAARIVLRARIKDDASAARAAEQAAEKRGGRVAERFIIALPIEATAAQRVALAEAFAEELTRGVAGYVLAIHDTNASDAKNPHFHLVAFDAFEKSGGRGRPRSVLGMARKGAVERAAALWSQLHNDRMTAWGYDDASRISHLSYAERGIERIPTIHEGPGSRKAAARGVVPAAKNQWKHIDAGQTRAAANQLIREINRLKERTDDDDRGDRLGRNNDRHPAERGESGGIDRTDDRRRGRAATTTEPPFLRAQRRNEKDSGAGSPAWIADRAREGHTRDHHLPFPESSPSRQPRPSSGPLCRRRGARRVRRIFVELMMLRDTLRARLDLAKRRLSPSPHRETPDTREPQLPEESSLNARHDRHSRVERA